MAGLTLDAGALIAAERNDRAFWAFFKGATQEGVVMNIPAGVLAQVWRGAEQARLAQLINSCYVVALDENIAKAAGVLCGRTGTVDVVDASVVAVAARRGDSVLTSDARDIRTLATAAGGIKVIPLRGATRG